MRIRVEKSGSGGHSFVPHIVIFTFLVVLSAFGLYPVHKIIRERTEALRDGLILKMEEVFRRRIEYGSMGPSLFGTIDIRDIRVGGGEEAGASEPEELIRIFRMRISWSLLKLLRGEPDIVRAVRLDRPALYFDYRRDQDLLELFANQERLEELLSWNNREMRAPKGMMVRIRNGSLAFKTPEDTFGADFLLDRLYLDASFNDTRIALRGKWNLNLFLTGAFGDPFKLASLGRISSSWSSDFREGTVQVNMPFISGDFFRIGALGVQISLRDNKIEARKVSDRSPLDVSLDYLLDTRELAASFRCEEFSLRDLVSLSGAFRVFNPWLAARTSGGGSLALDREGNIRYDTDLTGRVPRNLSIADSSFTVKASGDKNYIRFDRLSLDIPPRPTSEGVSQGGAIRFHGGLGLKPFAPSGTISLSNFSMAAEPSTAVNAELAVSTRGNEIGISGAKVLFGSLELAAFGIFLYPEASGIGFDLSALSLQEEGRGSIALGGTIAYDPLHLEAYCRLDSFSALDLVNMTEPFAGNLNLPALGEVFARETTVSTDIFVSTDFEHILYNVPQMLILCQGMGGMSARFSASGTDRRFELTEGRINGFGWDEVLLAGYVDFPNFQDISFSLDSSYKETSYFLEGQFLDHRLSVRGSYGISGSVEAGPGGYSGYFEAVDIPIPIRAQMARLGFSGSLRYSSRNFWFVNIDKLDLRDINLPGAPGASLFVSGGANQDGASFDRFLFDDGMGQLSGGASVDWNADFSDFQGRLNISNETGSEVYQGEGSWRNRNLDLFFSGTGMRLSRIMENVSGREQDNTLDNPLNSALANGNVRLNWNPEDSFRFGMDLDSLSLRSRNMDIEASFQAVLDKDEFSLQNLKVKLADLEGTIPWFAVRRQDNWAGGAGRLEGSFAGKDMAMSFALDSQFAGLDSWLEMPQALSDFQGKLSVWDVRMDALGSEPEQTFDFVFSRQGSLVSFSGGPGEMIRFRLGEGGIFYAGFSHPSPIRGSVAGTISPSRIDARAADIYVDLSALWQFVPANTGLEAHGGYITADVDIRGSLADPEFFGSARGNSIRLRIPQFVDADIRPVPVNISLEGNEMRFGPVPAACGSGSGMLSGWFQFDRWIPNVFSIDVAVSGGSPIPVKFDVQGVLVSGIVSGNLNIAMEDLSLMIKGDLTAQESEISLDAAELARVQEEDSWELLPVSIRADIGITAGRRVEFLWPTRDFPMLRAYADMGAKTQVTVDTADRRFSFVGDVKLRSGEIFYFERNFFIRSGTLSFNENEEEFNPRISARAETKDRSNEGPVTISMVVDNAPLLSFQARFESSPALSQMEIFSLLGQSITGTPNSAEGGAINNAFLASSVDILTQFQVVRRIERTIRDFLRLDMFSIRTQVLQNYVFRAIGLEKDPVDRIATVGNYFDNTSVFVGKYIGSDMFIQSMVSLRYDETQPTMGGYTFEPDFSVELRSPLGNIRWNLVPTHPENWYISDNSFTISWDWVF